MSGQGFDYNAPITGFPYGYAISSDPGHLQAPGHWASVRQNAYQYGPSHREHHHGVSAASRPPIRAMPRIEPATLTKGADPTVTFTLRPADGGQYRVQGLSYDASGPSIANAMSAMLLTEGFDPFHDTLDVDTSNFSDPYGYLYRTGHELAEELNTTQTHLADSERVSYRYLTPESFDGLLEDARSGKLHNAALLWHGTPLLEEFEEQKKTRPGQLVPIFARGSNKVQLTSIVLPMTDLETITAAQDSGLPTFIYHSKPNAVEGYTRLCGLFSECREGQVDAFESYLTKDENPHADSHRIEKLGKQEMFRSSVPSADLQQYKQRLHAVCSGVGISSCEVSPSQYNDWVTRVVRPDALCSGR